jgi:4a-hydroxytetrahydrobiopterin dehydratase
MSDLTTRKCKPCEGGVDPLKPAEVENLLQHLNGWTVEERAIARTYSFHNYYETMAFVNATAWISHREDHQPDLTVGYRTCRVAYTTHAIDGLSENDFICAAKIDALFAL